MSNTRYPKVESDLLNDNQSVHSQTNGSQEPFYGSVSSDYGRYRSFRSLNTDITSMSNSTNCQLVSCPSCEGLGRVPKERENQLIALIPMTDTRLKPRRTRVYVAIAVILCLVTAGLLIFFLLPRDIDISSNSPFLDPDYVDINVTRKFANFTVTNHYNISNDNFYPLRITGILMTAQYGRALIASAWTHRFKNDSLEISARSKTDVAVPVTFIFNEEHYGSLVNHCTNPLKWIHNLPIQFEVNINYTYLDHSEQETLFTFQTVSCYPEDLPTTIVTSEPTTIVTHDSTYCEPPLIC